MPALVNYFADHFAVNDIRLFSGTASALQFPAVPVKTIRFKAWSSNVGSFFIGETANDLFFELDAGDDTGWCNLGNLNELWYYAPSGTSDKLAVWLQS